MVRSQIVCLPKTIIILYTYYIDFSCMIEVIAIFHFIYLKTVVEALVQKYIFMH